MPPLESSITAWRNQMLAAGVQSPVPLDELELHLREEIEALVESGLTAESAFNLAVQKIGPAPALQTEFTKNGVSGSGKKWERRLASIICFGLVIPLGLRNILINDLSPAWQLLGLANLGFFLAAVFGIRYLNQLFPFIPDRRIRTAIGATSALAGIIGMIVFANVILPQLTFTTGQLMIVFLWAMTGMVTLGAVWTGLEETARRKTNLTAR